MFTNFCYINFRTQDLILALYHRLPLVDAMIKSVTGINKELARLFIKKGITKQYHNLILINGYFNLINYSKIGSYSITYFETCIN